MSAESTHLEEEKRAWTAIDRVTGLRDKLRACVPERFPSASSLWHASRFRLRSRSGLSAEDVDQFIAARSGIDPGEAMTAVREVGADLLCQADPGYPSILRTLGKSAPRVLYFRGPAAVAAAERAAAASEILSGPFVAIVGSRAASAYGEYVAADLSTGLCAQGVRVVSGLAAGIDASAHWGAVDSGVPTVAVIGCGIDVIYPRSNRTLFSRVATTGVILSEYGPQVRPLAHHFPARNRIISALSVCVVVVEGGVRSGAMITARHALDQGRAVMAVPGSIYSPGSAGPLGLISDGAAPVTGVESILAEAGIDANRARVNTKTSAGGRGDGPDVPAEPDLREFLRAVPYTPLALEEVFSTSGRPPGEALSCFIRLEVAGFVSRCDDGSCFRLR